jgi:hypothetical protein
MTIIASMIRCLLKDNNTDLITSIQELIIQDPYYLGGHAVDFDAVDDIIKDSHEYDTLINTTLNEPHQTLTSFGIDQ